MSPFVSWNRAEQKHLYRHIKTVDIQIKYKEKVKCHKAE